jgi:hypothetical protein
MALGKLLTRVNKGVGGTWSRSNPPQAVWNPLSLNRLLLRWFSEAAPL